ncbi:BTAD domain-containing putative transcriptional regulator [Deinococcus sonorensis]|uniref:BTAD domain-containing putative transcriptional regulator n=2 Tax=Deinococcus sonorensis TaxID=309891 RepID=A0AAU7U5D2_9DEIO
MAPVELLLLGRPTLRAGGTEVHVRSSKALGLLAYLVLEGGWHPRERLAGLLWPDSEPAVARSALRNALAALRAVFGEARVRAERDGLRWVEEPGDTVDALWWRAAPGDPLAGEDQAAHVPGLLLSGLDLQDDGDFQDWLELQRSHAQRAVTETYRQWSGALSERGEARGALRCALAWLELEPQQEDAVLSVMQLHVQLGHPHQARRAYDAHRDLLARQYGSVPGKRLKAFLEALPAAEPAALVAELHAPLAGRASPFSSLIAAFSLARQSGAQAVLVSGEPGVGKTRLCSDVLAWADAQGACSLVAASFV